MTVHVPSRSTVEHVDRGPLDRRELAAIIARDIPRGSYVNLGIGQPTTVAEYLTPEADVVLHTENGMLGMGGEAVGEAIDADLMNAGKIPVTETPGASYFHHADSFAMMRGGHLDVCVLGAFQVSERGDLANWHTGARCHSSGRRSHGSRHWCERCICDDEPVHQGRHREAGSAMHISPDRTALRQPGLHRSCDL
jgi:3-oxoadipate CoA-transferase, beta subunit